MPEKTCPVLHNNIAEAIECAEKRLGFWRKPASPYFGTMKHNCGVVIGFQSSPRRRWRLDYDPNSAHNKWTHVNEENFDADPSEQKTCHVVYSPLKTDLQVMHYYQRWTKTYDRS